MILKSTREFIKYWGLCFHNWEYIPKSVRFEGIIDGGLWECKCKNCGILGVSDSNYNFTSTWDAFGIMWEFMRKHDRWIEFIFHICTDNYFDEDNTEHPSLPVDIISPRPFAEAMCEFLRRKSRMDFYEFINAATLIMGGILIVLFIRDIF